MKSWFFRRPRAVRTSRVSFLSPRIEAFEDRINPAPTLVAAAPFNSSVPAPNPQSWDLLVGDFNGDGIDDFLSPSGFGNNKLGVYQGTGAETFVLKVTFDFSAFGGGIKPESAVFADLISPGGGAPDGLDDFAFIEPTFSEVVVFASNGDGTFGPAFSGTATTFTRISMAAGDFNADGMNDLVLGRFGGGGPNGTAGEYEVLLNNGNGTFTALQRTGTNNLDWIERQPTVLDINNDGKQDFVAHNLFPVAGTGRGGVYFGNGDGTFTGGAGLATGVNANINQHMVGDFDGDGRTDVALVSNGTSDATVYVFYQTALGVFQSSPGATFTTDFVVQDVNAADLDFDSDADMMFTPFSAIDPSFRVYDGNPGKTYPSGGGIAIATAGVNSPIAIIDGDNNGTPDVLVGTRTDTGSIAKFQYFDNVAVPTGPIQSTVTTSALPNPVVFGNAVTFSASVSQFGNVPTGSVEFFANGVSVGSAPLDAKGKATFVAPGPFAVGNVSVTANYSGDAQYVAANAFASFTVQPLPSVISVDYTAIIPPEPPTFPNALSVFGANVTINAAITPVGSFVPTGSFQFFANSTLLGTVPVDATGKATLITPSVPVGDGITISTTYINDPIYTSALIASPTLIDVVILPTALDVVTSSNPAVFGQPLSYTVTITADPTFAPFVNPIFSGPVVIFDNDNVIASLNFDPTGKAVFIVPAGYEIGNHGIQAVFPGTANLDASASTIFTQVITKANSTLTLAANQSTITFGESVTLTATAAIAPPGVGSPFGDVSFFQNGSPLGTVSVDSSGIATLTVPSLAAGSYTFTSSFSGNDTVFGSSSPSQVVTVNPTTSTTTFTVTPSASTLGSPIVLGATVLDANSLPVTVGTVTFTGTFNGVPLDPQIVNVVNGQASFTYPGTTFLFGSGEFSAEYSGDVSITGSSAGPIAFTVDRAVPAMALTTTSSTTIPLGTTTPFTVQLTPPGGVIIPITGTVSFFEDGVLFDTVTVVNGQAATSRLLSLGTHQITASYSGDANYANRDAGPIGVNVFRPTDRFSVGAGAGGPDRVNVYNAAGEKVFSPLFAFSPDHTAGVRVATADFDGDGVQDVAMGTGPGTGSRVRILSGVNGAPIADFSPFGEEFTGGVFVSAGDVNGDFKPDLVVTPDRRGGARIRVYNGLNFSTMADFIGIVDGNGNPDTSFRGGARAAIGDVNADGFGEVVVAAGVGGGPRIAVFNGKTLTLNGGPKVSGDFLAFESSLRNGAFIAVGDINADGFADLITAAGPGGGPRVTVYSGAAYTGGSSAKIADFFAGDVNARGGVPVASRYLDGDDNLDLITGDGGGGDTVTAYLGINVVGAFAPPPTFLQFEAFSNTPNPEDAFRGAFVG